MKRKLTYEELEGIARNVADYIKEKYSDTPYDLIAISRGGVTFGHLVSYYLAHPLHYFSTNLGCVLWTTPGEYEDDDSVMIFLEDIIAQGRTFDIVKKYADGIMDARWEFIPIVMDANAPAYIKTRVNKVGLETDDWIVFPHEQFGLTVEGDRGLFREGTSANSKMEPQ